MSRVIRWVLGCTLVFYAAAYLGGCQDSGESVGPGEPCLRTFQCAEGLACVMGVCTSDLSALEMNAMVPPLPDGGSVMMMGSDGGSTPTDGGTAPPPADGG